MSAHRHQATWRDITFNRRYEDSGSYPPDDPRNIVAAYAHNDYQLNSMNPTSLSVEDMREVRQFLEGAEPNQAFEGSRLLELEGKISASSHGTLEDMTWALYESFSPAACRLAFALNSPAHVGPFDFKRDTATTPLSLRFYCRPAIGRPIVFGRRTEGFVRPYMIRLIAYDPKCYALTETATALGNLAGGDNTVTNAGNQATDPRIEIVLSGAGHATFTLTNATTQHAIILNLSGLAAGTYTLNVLDGTFTKSDGTNVLSTRVSGFPVNMWLASGANTITVTGNTNLTSVTFRFRAAYA